MAKRKSKAATGNPKSAMESYAKTIVNVARRKLTSTEWGYSTAKDDFEANTNKCNQFVYDVLVEAGVQPLPRVTKYLVFTRAPTAAEWADKNLKITGWPVVAQPMPGDVIAEAHYYPDATGHVGIVVGPNDTISASSLLAGQITLNDWGFRRDSHPTFRRCMG